MPHAIGLSSDTWHGTFSSCATTAHRRQHRLRAATDDLARPRRFARPPAESAMSPTREQPSLPSSVLKCTSTPDRRKSSTPAKKSLFFGRRSKASLVWLLPLGAADRRRFAGRGVLGRASETAFGRCRRRPSPHARRGDENRKAVAQRTPRLQFRCRLANSASRCVILPTSKYTRSMNVGRPAASGVTS